MKTSDVIIIGGGTGIYPVVTAAKALGKKCSCIINCSDSGGSTGRIRDEFGFPPVGDLRQSLAALADPISQKEIRDVLLYRFSKGSSLKGHNLGNLIITALQDMTGSTTKALEMAHKVFRIDGRVIPVSEQPYTLHITYADGTILVGEDKLDDPTSPHQDVIELSLEPTPKLNPTIKPIVDQAKYILIGPGDFYASLQSVLMVPGFKKILSRSQAHIIYFLNIMTRATQTMHMPASAHVRAIENSIGRSVDTIIINSAPIRSQTLKQYASEDEHVVAFDMTNDPRIRAYPLATESALRDRSDMVPRSLLRHDATIIQQALTDIFTSV